MADLAEHFRARLLERYGIATSEADIPEIAALVRDGILQSRAKNRSHLEFRLIKYRGKAITVLYNTRSGHLVTAMPPGRTRKPPKPVRHRRSKLERRGREGKPEPRRSARNQL